jgi:hypothetical protein
MCASVWRPSTESVTVTGDATHVDTATNTLGKTVGGREVLDLPLNGRNFTQLGLLQTGVAPVSDGVLENRRHAARRPGVFGERAAA